MEERSSPNFCFWKMPKTLSNFFPVNSWRLRWHWGFVLHLFVESSIKLSNHSDTVCVCNPLWKSPKKKKKKEKEEEEEILLKCVIALLAPTSLTHIQHHALNVWTEEKWSFAFVAASIWLAVTTWTVWCLQSHLVCITYHSPHSACLGGKSLAPPSTHSPH